MPPIAPSKFFVVLLFTDLSGGLRSRKNNILYCTDISNITDKYRQPIYQAVSSNVNK